MRRSPIIQNASCFFSQLQVLTVAEEFASPDIRDHVRVCDDRIVKRMIPIEGLKEKLKTKIYSLHGKSVVR